MMKILASIVLQITLFCVAVAANSEHSTQCNPQKRQLFGKFFLQRWTDARRNIGLQEDPFNIPDDKRDDQTMLKYIKLVDHVINTVFGYTYGAKVFFYGDIPIPYIPIPACLENNIMTNLDEMTTLNKTMSRKARKSIYMQRVVKTQTQLDLLLSAACITAEYKQYLTDSSSSRADKRNLHLETNYSCSSLRTFTFVLDPFQHFMKGFADYVWSPYYHKFRRTPGPNGYVRALNLTVGKEAFLEIFEAKNLKMAGIQFIYPMSASLFAFDIDIVGHVDNFYNDWNNIIAPYYLLTGQSYEYGEGNKFSQANPNYLSERSTVNLTHGILFHREVETADARNTLHHLFLHDEGFARAICHLVLIDYICLPMYPLPAVCSFLQKTRDNAVECLNNNREVPPDIIL